METISVYYKPIMNVNGIAYHETLVYTNSSGQTFYTSGSPSIGTEGTVSDLAGHAISNLAGNASFGTLTAQVNQSVNINNSQFTMNTATGAFWPSQTITSGTDLSATWGEINSAANYIANQGLSYSMMSQNSNSLTISAL